MHYKISHTTVYEYDQPVAVSHHLLRLTPRTQHGQRALSHRLDTTPKPAVLQSHTDYFGNLTAFLTIEGAHRELLVRADSVLEVSACPAPESTTTPAWETIRELCSAALPNLAQAASEFVFASPLVPLRPVFVAYAAPSFPPQCPVLEGATDLMHRIHADFKFDTQATTVTTPVEQFFRQRRGVCQDFAQFQIACLRSLGLPARYVSGYLETRPPPGKPRLVGADASHAWLQLWCGETGWVDLDPTNDMFRNERHITLAWGRDFGDVSPLRGVLIGSGRHRMQVQVDVVPLPENDQTGTEANGAEHRTEEKSSN